MLSKLPKWLFRRSFRKKSIFNLAKLINYETRFYFLKKLLKLFEGCSHETCNCADKENNADFLQCQVQANENYFSCINNCPVNDMVCISNCGRSYEHFIERCPCEESELF